MRRSIPSFAAASFLALVFVACATGPSIVPDRAVEASAQRQWQEIIENMPRVDDAVARDRVQRVSEALLRAADEDPENWEVELFDKDDTLNAFALPNRAIGVFSGLLNVAETDGQLAAILGHEIAHVKLRHGETRVNRELGPRVLIGAARLPGNVVNIGPVKSVSEAAGGLVAAGTIYPFSRSDELEADSLGLEYMLAAGYEAEEAIMFWRRVVDAQQGKTQPLEVLSTHPSTERRIAKLEEIAAQR